MHIEVVRFNELGASERQRWRVLQTATPYLANPFFSFAFAQTISERRSDARVALISDGAAIEGIFPVQRPSPFAAMPLGAPLNHYQGVIGSPELGLTIADLCRALRVGRLDFTHVPAAMEAFSRHALGAHHSWIAELQGSPYYPQLRTRRHKMVYELERKERKLAREHGAVAFLADTRDVAHLDALLDWKSAQMRRISQTSFWCAPSARAILSRSLTSADPDFGGLMFALCVGGRLAAVSYCFRGRAVLHGALMAHDPVFASYSPGLQLAVKLIEWAQTNGYREVDFGAGDHEFKRHLATRHRPLVWGWAGRPSFSSASRRAQYALRRRIEKTPNEWIAAIPGRAMRRIDWMRGLGAPPAARSSYATSIAVDLASHQGDSPLVGS